MYKLMLVSDREDVLNAFDQVRNWGFNGFNQPHVRASVEGAREGLQRHHADGIAYALSPEENAKMFDFLRAEYPMLPIFEAGRTPLEVNKYLEELLKLLNRLHADFSSDFYDEQEMMIRARRHFFRGLVSGKQMTCEELTRNMMLLRSRMDARRPCVLMSMQLSGAADDGLEGLLQDRDHLLERELNHSLGGDVGGYHVLPLVTGDGRAFVLAGSLMDSEQEENITAILNEYVREGIRHAEEYRGIHLRVTEVHVMPSLYAFCHDYAG